MVRSFKTIRSFMVVLLTLAMVVAMLFGLLPAERVLAAGPFTITYVDATGAEISTATVNEGDPIGALPVVADSFVFLDKEKVREVLATDIPDSDMTVTVYKNADLGGKNGVMAGGTVKWLIYNGELYVVGNGTISISNKGGTAPKTYGPSVNTVTVYYPAMKSDWVTATAVGDEQTTGFHHYTTPADPTHSEDVNITHSTTLAGQPVKLPSDSLDVAAPWLADAATITNAYFGSDVSLAGNYTYYFNQATPGVLDAGTVNPSVYSALTRIYLYSDTSGITSASGMFARCPALQKVIVPTTGFDATSITDMSGMFYGDELLDCDDDDSIVNKLENTSTVTDMRYMFFDCQSIEHPALAHLDTSSVTDMSYMFTGCENAKLTCGVSNTSDYDIQSWDTSNVVFMGGMFAGPEIDITLAHPIKNLFGYSTSVVTDGVFDLSKWDLSSLKSAYYMFGQNHGLTGVKFTNSAPLLEDISCMFMWTDQLSNVDMAGASTPALKYIDFMFFSAGADSGVADFTSWDMGTVESAVYAFYNTSFQIMNFDGTNPASLVNAKGMFSDSTNLISFGDGNLGSWTLANLENASYMFNDIPAVASIDSAGWDMGSVQDMSYMFSNDAALTGLDTSGWNISNALTNMDCFAYGCTLIPTLDAHNWDVSGVNSAFMAFALMENLATMDVSGWDLTSLLDGYGMWAYDYVLSGIDFGTASAPLLQDASGMFYDNVSSVSTGVKNLIGGACTNLSYMFAGNTSLPALDVSGWNTANVVFMQDLFESNTALADLTLGDNFVTTSAEDTAEMFLNDSLIPDATLQSFIADKFDATTVKDSYSMFKGLTQLTEADMSGTSFAADADMTQMFYGDDALVEITLPSNFFSGIGAMATKGKNVFYCTEETPTILVVDNATLPPLIANYDWSGDHRTFITLAPSMINGVERTSYKFPTTETTPAEMQLRATSSMYTQATPVPLTYSWSYGGTPIAGATDPTFSATRDDVGSYIASAKLTGVPNSDEASDIFTLTTDLGVKSIEAKYLGSSVTVSKPYSKSDVQVIVTFEDNSKKTLTVGEWSTGDQTVKKQGDNTFTASYTDSDGKVWSANFVVPGVRVLASLDVTYTGPSVLVGQEWNKQYITAKAYYLDDTSKSEPVTVTPTKYSSNTVTKVGANSYTATYVDTANKNNELTATFTVQGYKNTNIKSIDAVYVGPDVIVGNEYDKGNVKVTVHYSDGTPDTLTTTFTVDSKMVSKTGVNTYKATYTDANGKTYTADFNVTGIPASAAGGGGTTPSGTTPSSSTATGANTTAYASGDPTAMSSVGIKTGDQSQILIAVFVMFGFGAIAIFLVYYLRKNGTLKSGHWKNKEK